MKIAWFTPFSRNSAIGQCSSIIVQALSEFADIVVYVADTTNSAETWLPRFRQRFIQSSSMPELLKTLDEFDIVVYNLGDNYLLHGNIYRVFRSYPGIVILHDLVMHHFFSGYYFLDEKNPEAYIDELAFSHGETGRELGRRVIAGHAGNIWEDTTMLEYHMAKSALQGCYGVITHSKFAKAAVEQFAVYPVTQIHFPEPNVHNVGLPEPHADGKTHFLSFGMLNSNKMIDQVISAIGQHPSLHERIVYNVIGKGTEEYIRRLESLISHYSLMGTVNLLGYQSDNVLHQYINDADVIINLRNPHFGESSWILLEAAFAAKPTVVWKHGYYDEFPDDTVAKVVGDNLVTTLEALASDESLRLTLSRRIENFARQTFVTKDYCQRLLNFIQIVRGNKPLMELADSFADRLSEIDPGNLDLLRLISTEIANLT